MANLVELFDNIVQMQNLNGVPLANGKMYVYALGRTRLMDTWSDVDGASLNSNPIILDAAGQCHCYVSDDFDYTLVVTDAYDNEIFSIDKYLYSQGSHSHADVAVAPSETIAVSSYHVGETTVYVPYLTGQLGKVYQGIDPIVVNNTEDKISANHVPLGVQDPLYFVQDDEEGCIIGFSGQTIPEGVMSESALGFENNKITGYNGSAFSAGNEYEAGSYVDITDNTISVTGLQPEGDYAYNSALSSKLDVTATGQFLTGLPEDLVYTADITGLATTAQLDEKLDKSDSGNFYPMDSNPSGYLTGLPSDLATTGFVADVSADITAMIPTGDYLTKETADTLYQPIGQYQSALDFGYVGSEISSINGSGIYSQGGTANPQIPVTSTSGISIFESGDKVYFNISADYAFNSDLQSVSAEITGMIPAPFDPSYLSGQIDTKLDSAIYANDSGTFLTALPQDLVYTADIADMATTGQVAEKLDTTAFSTVSGDFLTAHQDLSDYQTTAGMTAYQPVGSYLTADALDSVSGDWNEVSAKLDTTAFSDVSGTFLTAHQDISNKLDTTAFSDVSGSFLTAIPDTYLQNTDLSTEDGKVTAISGIPLSAGGEVPEGVMVESAVEYNAVNEISGYNGSAIAQYGAEKQWLVHDDTMVHLSNSSQFALGVNLSAVAQLLGVDETVLWSGNYIPSTTSISLSEPTTNFNTIKVYWQHQTAEKAVFEYVGDSEQWYAIGGRFATPNNVPCIFQSLWSGNYTNYDKKFCNYQFGSLTATPQDANELVPIKVIGIGRKQ